MKGTAYRPRDRYGYTMTLVQIDLVDGPYDPQLGDRIGAICFHEFEPAIAAIGGEAFDRVMAGERVDVTLS